MPAKSRSQQRLFGMVHAYNKGEFSGSKSLRKRIARLSAHISDEDAAHFARTKHDKLPEVKEAQLMLTNDQVREMYGYIPTASIGDAVKERAKKRRSLLRSVFNGASIGSAIGGAGFGLLGAYLANKASAGSGMSPADRRYHMLSSAARLGMWGALRGAGTGAAGGTALYAFNRLTEGDE